MVREIAYYSTALQQDILSLPAGIQARYARLTFKELRLARQRMNEVKNAHA